MSFPSHLDAVTALRPLFAQELQSPRVILSRTNGVGGGGGAGGGEPWEGPAFPTCGPGTTSAGSAGEGSL